MAERPLRYWGQKCEGLPLWQPQNDALMVYAVHIDEIEFHEIVLGISKVSGVWCKTAVRAFWSVPLVKVLYKNVKFHFS